MTLRRRPRKRQHRRHWQEWARHGRPLCRRERRQRRGERARAEVKALVLCSRARARRTRKKRVALTSVARQAAKRAPAELLRIQPTHSSEQAREPEQGVAVGRRDPDTLTDFTHRADEGV